MEQIIIGFSIIRDENMVTRSRVARSFERSATKNMALDSENAIKIDTNTSSPVAIPSMRNVMKI